MAERGHSLGRREADFATERVFVPTLIIDHTELALRQAGLVGREGFALWAGTIAARGAYVSTVVLPHISSSAGHGEVTAETAAATFEALDERDLTPVVQLHTHPGEAFLSAIDAIRPFVAVPGFISVIIPHFGFVDLARVDLWSAHEYRGASSWRELDKAERLMRFVLDDSIIRVDR